MPSVDLSIRLSVNLSVSVSPSVHLSVHPSLCASVRLSVSLSIRLSVCIMSIHQSVCFSVCPSARLSISSSVQQSVSLSVHLSVSLHVCLSILIVYSYNRVFLLIYPTFKTKPFLMYFWYLFNSPDHHLSCCSHPLLVANQVPIHDGAASECGSTIRKVNSSWNAGESECVQVGYGER